MGVRVPPGLPYNGEPMEDKNLVEKSRDFLREVVVEGKKVTWPDKRQTILATVAVVVFVLVSAGYLALADYIISLMLKLFA